MIENISVSNKQNLFIFVSHPNRIFLVKSGTIVKASVVKVSRDGNNAVLRVEVPSGKKENTQAVTLKASSEVPLKKGQNLYLEIISGRRNITMRFIGNFKNSPDALQQNIPVKFLDMLAQLSSARLGNSEFQQLLNILKSLPEGIKTAIPEFKTLETLLLDIKQLDGKLLKAFIESSGIAFETRLKIAILNDPGSILQSLTALQAEGDLKALLLRLKKLLNNRNIIASLKAAGYRVSEITHIIERFISHIEFFQVTSRLNDMFCTFIPVLWDELKDGEFLFKKNKERGKESYTCDINLELENIGKLAVSVTILDKALYVTFFTERKEIENLIKSRKHILENQFALQGLLLKALNVSPKKDISFGVTHSQEISIKI
jgi:hypothetical protein